MMNTKAEAETETWYTVERETPRNGHWYSVYHGASKDEARFALWNFVESREHGVRVRVSSNAQ